MKKLKLFTTFFLVPILILGAYNANCQTINIGPDQYAFQFTGNPNFGMFFNNVDSRYELRNGAAVPVFHVGALTGNTYVQGKLSVGLENPVVDFTVFQGRAHFGDFNGYAEFDQDGDLFFNGSSDYLVGANKYAFRYKGNEKYGLFFNAATGEYQFLSGIDDGTGKGTPIFTINSNTGDVTFTGTISGDGSGLTGIGSGSEIDPLWTASPSAAIANSDISNWNTAFGFGDHAAAGYLTSESQTLSFNNGTNQLTISGGNSIDLSSLSGTGVDADWNINGLNMSSAVSGNVGIGTASANSKLQIVGPDNNGLTAGLQITSGVQNLFLDGNEIDSDGDLFFNNNSGNDIRMGTSGGNLGIGLPNAITTAAKLHVWEDGIIDTPTVVAVLTAPVSNRPVLQFSEGTIGDLSSGFSIEYNGSGSGTENKLQINQIGGTPSMVFKNNLTANIIGNLGINKEDAAVRLDINEPSLQVLAAARIIGSTGAKAYLGVQGKTDFDGITSLDINGQEIGLIGISDGGSTNDNVGVFGYSNGVSGRFDHMTTGTSADLATTTHAAILNGKMIITGASDASLTNDGFVQLGASTGENIIIDNNEMMARNNGMADDLHLQLEGGSVKIGTNTSLSAKLFVDTDGNEDIVRFRDGTTTKFMMNGLGQVIINGTTAATDHELSVNGDIICEEIRVENSTNWPDFVFEEGYQLMPIDQLEAAIKTNKHLPNIPSAVEIESNGFDLGEMQKLQMQKIEELTLYILQLQNRIKKLESN